MTFWHNHKYEDLERSTINGDFLRGMPAKNFPWLLKNVTCTDNDHDKWQIKVLCLSIEGNELSQKIKAKISMEAHCLISKQTLQKIGIEYQRLFDLNLHGWNELTDKYILEVSCLIDKIQDKCNDFYKIFFQKIQEKYTLEKKKTVVTLQIKNGRISNFS